MVARDLSLLLTQHLSLVTCHFRTSDRRGDKARLTFTSSSQFALVNQNVVLRKLHRLPVVGQVVISSLG